MAKNNSNLNINEVFLNPRYSRLREQIVEYRFISDIIIEGLKVNKSIEVARSDHDSFGYDLILKNNKQTRFIQVKCKANSGKNNRWDIHRSLISSKEGFVVLILVDFKHEWNNLNLTYYISKKTKGNIKEIMDNDSKNRSDIFCEIQKHNFKECSLKNMIFTLFK